MEFVDLCYYLDLDRFSSERRESDKGAPFDALCETAQNLSDLASRLRGGNISHRPSIRGKQARIDVGEAIVLEPPRTDSKHTNKSTIDQLISKLACAYETSIRTYKENNLYSRSV